MFTTSEFAVRVVSGDHFYITSTVDEIVDDIETRIAEFGSSGS